MHTRILCLSSTQFFFLTKTTSFNDFFLQKNYDIVCFKERHCDTRFQPNIPIKYESPVSQ